MKMIQAIIRPEKEKDVIAALEKSGVHAFTRLDVFGRGRQKGLIAGTVQIGRASCRERVYVLV